MIDKEFLDKLKPVEIDYIAEYLMYKLGKKLVESDKIDNYDEDITYPELQTWYYIRR